MAPRKSGTMTSRRRHEDDCETEDRPLTLIIGGSIQHHHYHHADPDVKTILDQHTLLLEQIRMAIPQNAQQVIDQVNANTNLLAEVQTAWLKTLQDSLDQLASGQMSVDEFVTAAKPAVEAQTTAIQALKDMATSRDPMIMPSQPPIETPNNPDGSTVPNIGEGSASGTGTGSTSGSSEASGSSTGTEGSASTSGTSSQRRR